MKTIMLMFDSLNRHLLKPYNRDSFVHAPNFERLARRAVTFEKSYVSSMPCMPARRDFHTGRPSFLHCGWGPLEPFDDSVPQVLSEANVQTALISDHYHYWEDGGATYHGRYDTWQHYRGQEGDPYIGQVEEPVVPAHINGKGRRSDWVNREYIRDEADLPQTQTVEAGLDFIERNADGDRWFLQIECFDPHEPFVSHRKYEDLYPSDYEGPLFDWPGYQEVSESHEQVAEARRKYAALVSKCDASLGDVLDAMDENDLWDDTMLIVWTDHGFLLGEHNCWAKNWMPLYEEVSHTPFFIWDPRHPKSAGERRTALVQPALDLGPTLLGFHGLEKTDAMRGFDLEPVIAGDQSVRETAIFGYFGKDLNITDGRFVYMRRPVMKDGGPVNTYTLMPTSMRGYKLKPDQKLTLAGPFSFTDGLQVLAWGNETDGVPAENPDHMLFDLQKDPAQAATITDESVEARLLAAASAHLKECDAPPEQWVRLGISEERS